jgi:3-methyladenine DNA glycosylase AlkC
MNQLSIENLKSRKGAARISEVTDEVLVALNQGKIETVNLVEWLAINMSVLLRNVLAEIGWKDQIDYLHNQALKLEGQGITKRLKGVGELLFQALNKEENRTDIFESFAVHTSDMVRAWAAFIIAADQALSLTQRLEIMQRFAADCNISVKENAWSSLRPFLVEDLTTSFHLLIPWVKDEDPNIRRCAVEATRPRGVWCKHIPKLKEHPELGLVILEWVRSDSSDYVRRSVANWLNDGSKSSPNWVLQVCQRWKKESPTKETDWIIKHALRTLRRQEKFFQELNFLFSN